MSLIKVYKEPGSDESFYVTDEEIRRIFLSSYEGYFEVLLDDCIGYVKIDYS